MSVDIAQTCNYDIHSWCTMRIKFLRKEINHLSCNSCLMHNYVVVVVVVIYQDRIQSYGGRGLDVQECNPTSVICLY